jgi:leucine dehydrogenase
MRHGYHENTRSRPALPGTAGGLFMLIDVEGFHEVHRLDLGGATAFVAIHAAPHGRSFGGIRLRRYASDDDALADAKKLASAMTRKVLLAGIPAGGGKTVVRLPEEGWPAEARRAGMELLGEFIEDMSGLYHCGADLGFTDDDEAALRRTTRHVASRALGPWTALSVVESIRAVCDPRSVAVQGLGVVGARVAAEMLDAGARVVGSDVVPDPAPGVRGIERVEPDAIYGADCEVFSPCATGGVLDAGTIAQLRCWLVCGGANNPFAEDADADRLHARGIGYVPDVLANAGAVIKGASDALGESHLIERRMSAVGARVRAVLQRAADEGRSAHHVVQDEADRLLDLALRA